MSRHWNGAALCLTAFGVGVHRGAPAVHPDHQPLWRIPRGHGLPAVDRWPCCCCGRRLALDGFGRRGLGGWLLAGLSRPGRGGGQARPREQSRHRARRLSPPLPMSPSSSPDPSPARSSASSATQASFSSRSSAFSCARHRGRPGPAPAAARLLIGWSVGGKRACAWPLFQRRAAGQQEGLSMSSSESGIPRRVS